MFAAFVSSVQAMDDNAQYGIRSDENFLVVVPVIVVVEQVGTAYAGGRAPSMLASTVSSCGEQMRHSYLCSVLGAVIGLTGLRSNTDVMPISVSLPVFTLSITVTLVILPLFVT